MVDGHPTGGDEVGSLTPGDGEAGGEHCVQAQGGYGVVDHLHLHWDGGELGERNLPQLQPVPSGLVELGQENGGGLPQDDHLGVFLAYQNIPHFFPSQPDAHESAQQIPVAQLGVGGESGLYSG